jgi:hypothetical protein
MCFRSLSSSYIQKCSWGGTSTMNPCSLKAWSGESPDQVSHLADPGIIWVTPSKVISDVSCRPRVEEYTEAARRLRSQRLGHLRIPVCTALFMTCCRTGHSSECSNPDGWVLDASPAHLVEQTTMSTNTSSMSALQLTKAASHSRPCSCRIERVAGSDIVRHRQADGLEEAGMPLPWHTARDIEGGATLSLAK